MRKFKIISLLICTNIQCTDYYLLACHSFSNLLIYSKLFIFCRIIFRTKIYELRTEQAYSTCIILQHQPQVLSVTNICIYIYMLSIDSNIILALKLFQKCFLLLLMLNYLLLLCENILIRIYINFALKAINYSFSAIHFISKRYIASDDCRYIHSLRKYRCVRICRTMNSYEGKYFVLIHLNCFRRSQVICNHYDRLICHNSCISTT